MASKAHVIHDYSFGGARSLRRRQAWLLREEPVTLPKSSFWVAGFGAFATAAATAAIVAAGAYAAYHVAPARLTETPALVPAERWQPDLALVSQAGLVNLLQGPARAVPDKATSALASVDPAAATEATSSGAREIIIDDSKLYPLDESKRYPRTAPPEQPPVPYPNPTTTPPDAIAPPAPPMMTPAEPAPSLDPENPYRDGV
ncbi:MAG TPA: hypothetical protein VHP33_28525 [Polyangiaceae bacterium]|nr:hypothetical protein [Polyangiaceae bacterium]